MGEYFSQENISPVDSFTAIIYWYDLLLLSTDICELNENPIINGQV